jgi:cytochrome c oxidase subunit II
VSQVVGGDGAAGSVPIDEQGGRRPNHIGRLVAIWVVLSVVGDLVYWFVAGPHVPPGAMTTSASGAQFDFNVLFVVALPVIIGVWTYMAYALVMWRASRWVGEGDPVNGPRTRSNLKVQVAWIVTTTITVLGMFVFGTVELIIPAGAGGAEGPNPVWTPTSKTILPVQVIAQQWKFTYRYPTFGGMETNNLVVPDDTSIAFHVTSLDVIHSFWAYQLGVKADANPAIDNVAFTKTQQTGTVTIRCSELCGIWHGAMYDYGKVVSKSEFMKWGTATEKAQADNTKNLPPFAWTYVPDANGATGVYANTSGQAPFSPTQKYGATKAAPKVTSPSTVTSTVTATTSTSTVTATTTSASTTTPSIKKLTRENTGTTL